MIGRDISIAWTVRTAIRLGSLVVLLAAAVPGSDWRTYRDTRQGFAFGYPADCTMKPLTSPEGSLISASLTKGRAAIDITVKDLADYPAEWRAQGRATFVDAAVAIARLLCDAGGADGERECPEVLRQSTFANPRGLECAELELREEIRSHEPPRLVIRTRGPIYAVRMAGTALPVIIFFEFDPEYRPSAAERNLLAEIVNSVRPSTKIDE